MTRVVIIGSGMSGLTAAAYFARDGAQVDVFEQADHIGGMTSTLRKDGFGWDLGPLMAEGFAPSEPTGKLLAELGCADRFEVVRGDRGMSFPDFTILRGPEFAGPYWRRERMKEIFPHEADNLDRYYKFYDTMMDLMSLNRQAEATNPLMALLLKLRMAPLFNRVKPWQDWSAKQLMDHFFTDPKIKAIFEGILADMVILPSEFPALAIPALNPENYYERRIPLKISSAGPRLGYYFPIGGWGSLVEAVAGVVREKGGRLHTSSPVRSILIEKDRVRGVELADGQRVEADVVLASGDARECFFKLIGRENLPGDFAAKIDDIPLMESVFVVHLGVDMDPTPYQDLALHYYYNIYDLEDGVARTQQGPYHEGKDGFLIYILSLHSPNLAPPGQHAITVYTIAPNKIEGGWEARRQEMTEKLLHEAEKIIPGLRENAKVIVSLTPDDYKKLSQMPDHHSFGGFRPVLGKHGAPHRGPFEGLWFIGQQSDAPGGVNGVMLSARKVYNMVKAGH
jgi:phytoene dehydrogenase-like protein